MSFLSRTRVRAALVIAGVFGAVWSLVPLGIGLVSGRFKGMGLGDVALTFAKGTAISILTGTIMGLVFAALISRPVRFGTSPRRISRFFAFGAAGGLVAFGLLLIDAALRGHVQVNVLLGAATFMVSGGVIGALLGKLTSGASDTQNFTDAGIVDGVDDHNALPDASYSYGSMSAPDAQSSSSTDEHPALRRNWDDRPKRHHRL